MVQDIRMGWAFTANVLQQGDSLMSGVLTASVGPSFRSLSFLSEDREPFYGTAKPAMMTLYSIEGQNDSLMVLNIHSLNFNFGLKEYARQLEPLMRLVVCHHGPVILAGDFNTWSKGRSRVLMQKTEQAGLTHFVFSNNADHRTRFMGQPVDHVFYQAQSLTPIYDNCSVPDDQGLSDHRPLCVTFSYRHDVP